MAAMAVINAPCNFAIMTLATEITRDDGCHGNVVASSSHFEYFWMTNITCESETMEPVRKNYRPHSFLVGMPVKHDVSIFAMGNWRNHRHTKHKKYHPMFNGHHNPPKKSTPSS
ncbi:MAG: hypothetical protein WB870_00950 [Gallionellaceae bacterium]